MVKGEPTKKERLEKSKTTVGKKFENSPDKERGRQGKWVEPLQRRSEARRVQ